MNFIKVISLLLLPIIAFSYSYFYFAGDSLESTQVSINLPIQEEIITKIATEALTAMSVKATISSVFIVNKTNTLVLDLQFSKGYNFSPLREFKIFYALTNSLFYNFSSIYYIRFVRPVFIKYISTKELITRDEVKYEDK
jgi:hypothetical protein